MEVVAVSLICKLFGAGIPSRFVEMSGIEFDNFASNLNYKVACNWSNCSELHVGDNLLGYAVGRGTTGQFFWSDNCDQ